MLEISQKLSMLLCLSLSIFSLHAQDIHWLKADFEPCHVLDKAKKAGYCDLIDKLTIDTLPEYHHTFEFSTSDRYANIMATEKEFCTTDLLRSPQREKYMLYSNIRLYILSNGLLAREGDTRLDPYLNDEGEIELKQILRSKLALGLNEKRVYGAGIDNLLQDLGNQSPIAFTGNENKTAQLLVMKRFDYTLGFPTEIGLIEQDAKLQHRVVYFPIAGETRLLPTYVSCRKSALGQQIINKINQRFRIENDDAITEAYLSWVPKKQHQYYRNLLSAIAK
ncbi:MAG: hypothetical protein ACJA13_000554 [Paraglaciecola sp.]|jgi:uncharacterized protein (TIGR02285 family)